MSVVFVAFKSYLFLLLIVAEYRRKHHLDYLKETCDCFVVWLTCLTGVDAPY
nr:MAG TPA: hypothetical protein [Caudoviricetes sp.]